MRFLIISQYFPPEPGAAQTRLGAVAKHLMRKGHQVEVITALPNYPAGRIWHGYRRSLLKSERIDGISTRRLWLFAARGSGVSRLIGYLSFALTSLLAALAGRRRPDVVVVESPPLFLAITGWAASRRWKAPLILNVSDLWPESVVALGLMRRGKVLRLAESLETWAYSRSTGITAVTEGIRRALTEHIAAEPGSVLYLPNGADTDLYRPQMKPDLALAERYRLPTDGRLIVVAGTMGYAAGVDLLVEAAYRLRDAGITLAAFGDGSERGRVKASAQRLGLTDLRFNDPVPEPIVARLYGLAAAGLVTLRKSPLQGGIRPARMLPVMASGKPVIYAGSGEGADLVRRANAGVVVAPGDADALAGAMRWIIENRGKAETMGRNGRRYVEEHLRWDSLTDSWLRELEVLLARQNPASAR